MGTIQFWKKIGATTTLLHFFTELGGGVILGDDRLVLRNGAMVRILHLPVEGTRIKEVSERLEVAAKAGLWVKEPDERDPHKVEARKKEVRAGLGAKNLRSQGHLGTSG